MTKRPKGRMIARLDRIERKCDRIIAELVVLRHTMSGTTALDHALERMHASALRMRRECRREREALAALYADRR